MRMAIKKDRIEAVFFIISIASSEQQIEQTA